MARIEFEIRINGSGDSIGAAWADACEGFGQDCGPPDYSDITVYCGGCDQEVVGLSDLTDGDCEDCIDHEQTRKRMEP